MKMTLSSKHYKHVADIVADLTSLQSGRDVPKWPVASFSYNRISKRIRVQLVLFDRPNSTAGIQFSPDLAILLGFDSHVIYTADS